LVEEIIATQEPDGYIGLMKPDKRMWGLWDIHEMSYIILGLVTDYQLFGEKASLDSARKLADYIIKNWSAEPERKPGGGDITVYMAVTGSEPAMLELYKETGDEQYLEYCTELRKLQDWQGPIVLGRWGTIQGHAYAHMARCIAQLRLCRLKPTPELLVPTQRVIDFLTKQDGLVITGTCGDHECWHDTQEGTINLGETCATAYLIRLLDELFRMEGDTLYGDIMERAIFNALFAAQSPDGRRIRYYSPFDGPRIYFDKDTYCCPCNYRRIIAELPNMIYYRSNGGIAVNLYTPSTMTADLDSGISLNLRQETDYPNSGQVQVFVDPSKGSQFPLQLRIPRWCSKVDVSVNDDSINKGAQPGTMLVINRRWSPGDRVTLDMPMEWRLIKGRKAQAGKAAVLRGPMVFTLSRNTDTALSNVDLRLVTIDAASLEAPVDNDTVRENGLACNVRAWGPGQWYPFAEKDLTLKLTEFADPDGEITYFKTPNPQDGCLTEDELVQIE
ncbi:MAG: beta-L-arabinofuranosidase domain-containing protein, partial [bacterium]